MEGIEKAVPSVQLTEKLISYIDDVLRLEGDGKTTKELQRFSTAKEGSSVPFHVVRHVFQALKDAGISLSAHRSITSDRIVRSSSSSSSSSSVQRPPSSN